MKVVVAILVLAIIIGVIGYAGYYAGANMKPNETDAQRSERWCRANGKTNIEACVFAGLLARSAENVLYDHKNWEQDTGQCKSVYAKYDKAWWLKQGVKPPTADGLFAACVMIKQASRELDAWKAQQSRQERR